MTPLQFHFNAYALCTVETEEDENPTAELVGGFYASRESAERAADKEELDRRGIWNEWRKSQPEWRLGIGDKACFPPERLHYEIVSLAHVQFDSLDALQTAIEQAAALQFNGVGKMVA